MEKLYIVKIGGNIIDDAVLLTQCLQTFSFIKGQVILVHGGGKLATQMASVLGVQQTIIEGRRVTEEETLKIVTMVYAGTINKNIVAQLQSMGVNAMGLTGADGNLILAHKRVHPTLDYGFVGDVDQVNTKFIQQLLAQNSRLIIAPITHDGKGQLLNTNADTIAQSVACALSTLFEVHLIFGFEKEGVLRDLNAKESLIPTMNELTYSQLKEDKIIFEGMIPKIDNAFVALKGGVKSVIIGPAQKLNDLINGTAGTTIIL